MIFTEVIKNLSRGLFYFIILAFLFASCRGSKKASSNHPKEPSRKNSTNSNKSADKVIKTARSYIGTSYKYGGTTRAGLDCSGLVCISYKSLDIQLPRTSGEQSNFGKAVSIDELEKGDLVFFTDKKGRKKVTHVGMVTEVRGKESVKFIHSSTKLGVVEDDLFSPYYRPLFVKAVRVL